MHTFRDDLTDISAIKKKHCLLVFSASWVKMSIISRHPSCLQPVNQKNDRFYQKKEFFFVRYTDLMFTSCILKRMLFLAWHNKKCGQVVVGVVGNAVRGDDLYKCVVGSEVFSKIKLNVVLDTLIHSTYFLIIKRHNFRDDVTDISAIKKKHCLLVNFSASCVKMSIISKQPSCLKPVNRNKRKCLSDKLIWL